MTVDTHDVLKCTVEMHYETFGAIQNVYHLQNDGDAVSDIQAISDIVEALEGLMLIIGGFIALLQVVDGVRIYNVTVPAFLGIGQFDDNTPFTGSGEIQPTQVCAGLNLSTPRQGIFGRKYFGAGSAGMTADGGVLETGTLTQVLIAGEEMIDTFHGTYSDWSYGVVASLDGVFLPFMGYSAPIMAVIQRRRRLGVGI